MSNQVLVVVMGSLLGLLIGSFLNVCIVRLPADQSVVTPRSRCPQCGRPIAWYDNLPVVSWLLLRGKCRHCGQPISLQYPLVELAVGGLWAGAVLGYGVSLDALRAALFGTVLLGIAVTDARTAGSTGAEGVIPDEFTWGGLVLGLVLAAVNGLNSLAVAVLGASVGFLAIWIAGILGKWAFKKPAMGGGDVKMMAMVGAFVGYQGALLTIMLGALAGTLILGIPKLLRWRKQEYLPFGVFLALGAAITWIAGPALLAWYGRFSGLGGP